MNCTYSSSSIVARTYKPQKPQKPPKTPVTPEPRPDQPVSHVYLLITRDRHHRAARLLPSRSLSLALSRRDRCPSVTLHSPSLSPSSLLPSPFNFHPSFALSDVLCLCCHALFSCTTPLFPFLCVFPVFSLLYLSTPLAAFLCLPGLFPPCNSPTHIPPPNPHRFIIANHRDFLSPRILSWSLFLFLSFLSNLFLVVALLPLSLLSSTPPSSNILQNTYFFFITSSFLFFLSNPRPFS